MAAVAGPTTPQRPLPGAYQATPARAPTIFAANAASLRQQPQPPPADTTSNTNTTTRNIEPIALAVRKINDTLIQEERFPDLESYVTQGISGEYEMASSTAWMPFQKLKQYDLPSKLLDQANHSGVAMLMGIFPPLGHAWVALDNNLYLWDYTLPNPELVGWEDEQTHPITAVKLVPPKDGVFVKEIQHLIVVTTTVEMILLGVSTTTSPAGAKTVQLYQTKMAINVRGLSIDHVVSTAQGRIFFVGSQSEDIYEFRYYSDDGWFTNRAQRYCHTQTQLSFIPDNFTAMTQYFSGGKPRTRIEQLVVDDSRMILYARNSVSDIKVYNLQSELTLALNRKLSALLANAGHFSPRSDLLENRSLRSLSVIPASEATKLALVATTDTGCRLYMSLLHGYAQPAHGVRSVPASLQILHIRFPPRDPSQGGPSLQFGSTAATQFSNPATQVDISSRLLTVSDAGYRLPPGIFLDFMEDEKRQGRDKVFCAAPDLARFKNPNDTSQLNQRFSEFGMFLDLPGEFCEMMDMRTGAFGATNGPVGFGNELATQFDQPSAEIAIVTTSAVQIIRRRRMVDIFATMMRYASSSPEGLDGDIKRFIAKYGREETAASAFAVACGQGMDITSDARLTSITDPDVRANARKVVIEQGGDPEYNPNAITDGNASASDNVRPSPRCMGLALYISRLVRSIWRKPIITESGKAGEASQLSSTINTTKLREIQEALSKLLAFLEENRTFIRGLNGPQATSRGASRQDEIADQGESKHMDSLLKLIPRIVEGISFVLELFNNRVGDILNGVGDESRRKAKELTYESLFVSAAGRELAKELVKAIVNLNIANGSNVDTVAEALRKRCGSFCSADDVVIFKAQEQVKRASEAGSQSETGRVVLNESQRLFQKVAASLSQEHLTWAMDQYVNMNFYAGAIQLCLVVAEQRDRAKRALGWMRDGKPEGDGRKEDFEKRESCYNLVFYTLAILDDQTKNAPELMDGQFTVAAKRRTEAYDVVNTSDDVVFQTCLYDHYVANGQADRLLDIHTQYVVDYLKRCSQKDRAHADLLWRYYAHHNDFLQAASVQLDLARGYFDLSLEERIEYLSRARTNASTRQTALMDSRQSKQQLLREISDLLDVANIQDDILQRMKSEPRLSGERREEVLHQLDGPIMQIGDLFNQYADQASYYDICIVIYDVADHKNPADIKATWQALINQTDDQSNALYGKQALSWEIVGEKVREVGRRVNVSQVTFPIKTLLPMLERYAMAAHDQKPPSMWALDIFLSLEIPHETLLPVIEGMYYGNEQPFVGNKRKVLAGQMVYLLRSWFEESERKGERLVFGSEENASVVLDCAASLLRTGELDAGARRDAEGLVSSVQGTMR